jgi:hypothetical protein
MTSGTVLINRYELLGIIRNPVGCDVTAAFEGKVVPTRFCDEFQMVRAPRGASRPQPPFAPCSSAPRPASVSLPLSLSLSSPSFQARVLAEAPAQREAVLASMAAKRERATKLFGPCVEVKDDGSA